MIKTAHINILETGTATLSAGTEDPAYPLYRLHDRNIGRPFRSTLAETIEVRVDQGATGNQAVDRLLIPAGHNLASMTLDIKYSDDDITYTPAVAQWVQLDSGLIDKSWTPVTAPFWKFVITAPSSIPELAELFLTSTYEWERNPARPAGPFERVFNVENEVTAGGQDRFLVSGEPKRQRVYHLPHCGEAQKDNVLALYDGWGGGVPFWLQEQTGAWIYGKLRAGLDIKEVAHQTYSLDFDFLEVLP